MTNRSKALTNALALYRFSLQYDKESKKDNGWTIATFWFASGPKCFKTGKEMREFANKMVRAYK